MKICWDNLEGLRYSKNKECNNYVHGQVGCTYQDMQCRGNS